MKTKEMVLMYLAGTMFLIIGLYFLGFVYKAIHFLATFASEKTFVFLFLLTGIYIAVRQIKKRKTA